MQDNTRPTILCRIEDYALQRVVSPICKSLQITEDEFKRLLFFPILLILLFLAFILIWKLLGLPSSQELIHLIENLFKTHGYWIVFFAALLEGVLLIGLHVPGSVALVLACIVSRQGFLNPFGVWLVVMPAFFIAIIINYALGRFGWYRFFIRLGLKSALERMQIRVRERGLSIIFYTYFHPNFSAFSATSCGILQLPFRQFIFYSFIAILCWNTLWVAVFYFLGNYLIEYLTWWTLIFGFIGFTLTRLIVVVVRRKRGDK